MGVVSLVMGFKFDYISEINSWNKLVFRMLVQTQES